MIELIFCPFSKNKTIWIAGSRVGFEKMQNKFIWNFYNRNMEKSMFKPYKKQKDSAQFV